MKNTDYSFYSELSKNTIPWIRKVTEKEDFPDSSPGLPYFHLFIWFPFIVCVCLVDSESSLNRCFAKDKSTDFCLGVLT